MNPLLGIILFVSEVISEALSINTLANKERRKPLSGGDSISFNKKVLIDKLEKYLDNKDGINDSYKKEIVNIFTEKINNSDDNITVEQLEELKKHLEGEITKIVEKILN